MKNPPPTARPPRLIRFLLSVLVDGIQLEELDELFVRRVARVGIRPAKRAHCLELWWGLVARIPRSAGSDKVGTGKASGGCNRRRLAPSATQDIRFALRHAVRHRSAVAVLVITFALGIGTSSGMYSVVDSVLMRPLPYHDPEEFVSVYTTFPEHRGHEIFGSGWDRWGFSHMEYEAWREVQESFAMAAAIRLESERLSGAGNPERVPVASATWELFPMLGVVPKLGRLFDPEDDNRSGERIAVVSGAFWRGRLGSDTLAIGRTIQLTGVPHTIVGVLPDGFEVEGVQTELWTPIGRHATPMAFHNHTLRVMARLADGVTVEQAQAENERLLASLPVSPPEEHGANVVPCLFDRTRSARVPLLVLMGSSLLLLIIACANGSAVLLGLGIEREEEISVRGALGAGRFRLVRQLLTETLVLAVLGGLLGLLIAHVAVNLLVYLAPANLPRMEEVALDLHVLVFALAASTLTGVAAGLMPAVSLTRSDLACSIRKSRARATGRTRLMAALVVGELALATLLLVGAGLLTKTLIRLNAVDPGFRTEGLIAATVSVDEQLLGSEDDEGGNAEAYFSIIREALASLPGVGAVSVTTSLPMVGGQQISSVRPEGQEFEGSEGLTAEYVGGSHDHLNILGVNVVEGRGFAPDDDRADAVPALLINETLAQRAWPGVSPLGKGMSFWLGDFTVVGVVEGIKYDNLSESPNPQYFIPMGKVWQRQLPRHFVLAVDADVSAILPLVRDRIWSVAPDLPVTRVSPMTELISGTLAEQRYRARLMLAFSGIAIFLALFGVYGLAAQSVALRTREVAIRMALGADPTSVLSAVLCQGGGVAILGLAFGMALALAATHTLESSFFGAETNDYVTLLLVAGSVGITSLLASLPASMRATRVDPMLTLREE